MRLIHFCCTAKAPSPARDTHYDDRLDGLQDVQKGPGFIGGTQNDDHDSFIADCLLLRWCTSQLNIRAIVT
jgi:hypothetical protein